MYRKIELSIYSLILAQVEYHNLRNELHKAEELPLRAGEAKQLLRFADTQLRQWMQHLKRHFAFRYRLGMARIDDRRLLED